MRSAEKIDVFVLLLVYIVSAASETIPGYDCKTPDNEQGTCIDIRQCEHLLTILQKQPLTDESRNFLRSRQCGVLNGSPLVCCQQQRSASEHNRNLTEFCGVFLSDRIIGGLYTNLDEYPWTALIQYTDSDNTSKYSCSGALISENYVLSSAHCVNKSNADGSQVTISSVRLGEYDWATDNDCAGFSGFEYCADPPQDISIAEIIAHEEFRYNALRIPENDIALIRLTRPANYSDFVRPICLPIAERLHIVYPDSGKRFQVTGWSQDKQSSFDSRKMRFDVPYVARNECNRLYERNNITTGPKQLCTGRADENLGNALCQGDTFILSDVTYIKGAHRQYFKHYLVGLFSFEPRSCVSDGRPVINTNVLAYIDWIFDHMRV